jgi:hypothetical protein
MQDSCVICMSEESEFINEKTIIPCCNKIICHQCLIKWIYTPINSLEIAPGRLLELKRGIKMACPHCRHNFNITQFECTYWRYRCDECSTIINDYCFSYCSSCRMKKNRKLAVISTNVDLTKTMVTKSSGRNVIAVKTDKSYCFSWGNGHTLPLSCYALLIDGTIMYYYPDEWQSWSRCIPKWIPILRMSSVEN